MSDVSKTNELIAEADDHQAADLTDPDGDYCRNCADAWPCVTRRLADALETQTGVRVDMSSAVGVETQLAATRVPVQGEPNDDREVLAKVMDTLAYYHCRSVNPKVDHPRMGYHAMSEDQREFLQERQREAAEEILRMLPALSRATVPDAATEGSESAGMTYLEEMTALRSVVLHLVPGDWGDDEIGVLVEGLLATRWGTRLAYLPSDTNGIHSDARMVVGSVLGCGPQHGVVIDVVRALDDEGLLCFRAERDAALAAIERVRALAYQHRSVEQHNEMVPMSDIADLIREPSSADYLAALDGAPEPEEKP